MIKNKKTGQMYIGQSTDIERRWREHCKGKNIYNSYIDSAILKYKTNNFELKIIETLHNNKTILSKREKYWIKKYNTFKDNKHYNLTPGGECPPILKGNKNPNYGGLNEKTKKKLSKSHQGKTHTEKTKKKISKIHNTSGYYRVGKSKDPRCKQGFIWRYRYYDNGKQYTITSTNIKELEKKVKKKGLNWEKFN